MLAVVSTHWQLGEEFRGTMELMADTPDQTSTPGEVPPVGDAVRFAELLRENDPAMRRLASSMMRRSAAVDDVLQEAYLRAFRGFGSFRGEAAFSTWLYRIVYRACLDQLRRSRPVDSLDSLFERRSQEHFDSSDQIALSDALRRALSTLTPEHRAVIVLVDGEDYSYEEAAEILQIAPGTVASRVARARTALRSVYLQQNPNSDSDQSDGSGGRR